MRPVPPVGAHEGRRVRRVRRAAARVGPRAYRCFCTEDELEASRQKAVDEGRNPQYDGTWRDADPAEVQRRLDEGEAHTVRFRVEPGQQVAIDDQVRGPVSWDAEATVGDFILLRSNGMPVYNFCVAIDDMEMGITDVIRAEEHLTNTLRQGLILEALGRPLPRYARAARSSSARTAPSSRSATARPRATSSAARATCPRRWSTTSRCSAGTRAPTRRSTRSTS